MSTDLALLSPSVAWTLLLLPLLLLPVFRGRARLRWLAPTTLRALAFAGETNGRRVVCFAFDLAETSLRRSDHLSLVLFVLNALRWLTPPDPSWPLAVDVGETFRDSLPAPPEVSIVGPHGHRETRPALARMDIAIDEVGEHQLSVGAAKRTILGNLFDADESNIGRTEDEGEFTREGEVVKTTLVTAPGATRDLAGPILLFVLAILLLEWGHAIRGGADVD